MKFRIVQYKSGTICGIPHPTNADVDNIVITKNFGDVNISGATLFAWEEYFRGFDKVSGPKHTGNEALRFIRSFCYSNTFASLKTEWEFNDAKVQEKLNKIGVSIEDVTFLSPDI